MHLSHPCSQSRYTLEVFHVDVFKSHRLNKMQLYEFFINMKNLKVQKCMMQAVFFPNFIAEACRTTRVLTVLTTLNIHHD